MADSEPATTTAAPPEAVFAADAPPVNGANPSFKDRLSMIAGMFKPEQPAVAAEPEPTPEVEQPKPEPETEPEPVVAEAPPTRTYTEADLQAEVDKRDKQREEQRVATAERDRLKKLRIDDPMAYAEEMGQREEQEAQSRAQDEHFRSMARGFDTALLDPAMRMVPDEARRALLAAEGAGIGLEGRQKLMEQALQHIVKAARAEGAADAQDKLRKNDAFRKELLNELRSSPEFEEPELNPGSPRRRQVEYTMEDLLATDPLKDPKHYQEVRSAVLAQIP